MSVKGPGVRLRLSDGRQASSEEEEEGLSGRFAKRTQLLRCETARERDNRNRGRRVPPRRFAPSEPLGRAA